MGQRGRKSEAANGVPPNVDGRPDPLQPPPHLSSRQQKIFREIVSTAPPRQFSASDVFLVASLASVTALLQDATTAAGKANDKTRPAKIKTLSELCKIQAALCTKLRLTPQSRVSQVTAARQAAGHRPSAYDLINGGWDIFDDASRPS
jgi:hypothetical protein